MFWLVRSRVARHTLLHDDWGGIRWVRYHSVFWSRLSEVNPQWPWGLGWEERGGWERVSWGQGWLGGLLGWFLIAAKRSGLPVLRQMLTQEIRGLGFLFSHELLLHTASFFYFCRTVWHFRMQKYYFDRISICCFMRKNMSLYRLNFTSVELFSSNFCGHMSAWKTFVLLHCTNSTQQFPFIHLVLWDVCTHNTFNVQSSGHINDYHPSSYLCMQRPVWRWGAHAVKDHGLNRLRPFSCVRYDIAAWCLMGLEKEVNMSSTLWIPLHKEVDL